MKSPAKYGKILRTLAAPCLLTAMVGIASSCQDSVPTVGGDLAMGEVQIALDTLIWNGTDQTIHRGENSSIVNCPKIEYTTVFNDTIDARSTNNLLGRMSVPEYGDLHCSFVSRFMCTKVLGIPDSIPESQIDSMKLVLSVPRGALTGDSLAPQQLRAYRLTKSLPIDISNKFDPTGYYDPSDPLGSRSYTLSALGMKDSIYNSLSYIYITIPMAKEMALETVKAYRNEATKGIFEWPSSFEKYFHGIYVEPSFGRGCVASIEASTFLLYYHYFETKSVTSDGETKLETSSVADATGVFETSPIVLNSNNVSYKPSEYLKSLAASGESIITTPGGFRVNLRFPAKELIDIYNMSQSRLSVVSGLKFTIPAEDITNDYGITPPPYLLMVKTTKLKEFFENNSLPDNKESFYATYDKKAGAYEFSSMRSYILDLIENGVKDEDMDFTIVPVNLTIEDNSSSSSNYSYYSYYYGTSSSGSATVTKCTPYLLKPTMCRLKMDEATTVFTYSTQQMR